MATFTYVTKNCGIIPSFFFCVIIESEQLLIAPCLMELIIMKLKGRLPKKFAVGFDGSSLIYNLTESWNYSI